MKKIVSIVIPTYNRKEDLLKLLNSIKLSSYKNIEIVIINNSKDCLGDVVEKKVDLIVNNSTNLGLAKARSIGAEKSKGDYIFFIDDDNILDKFCIEKLVDTLDNNDNIVAAGPLTYYYTNRKKIWFLGVEYNFLTSKFTFLNDKPMSASCNLFQTDNLHNCFMVRKKFGQKVNWFDEKLFLGGTEFDFFMRVKNYYKGILVTDLRAICFHNIPPIEEKNEIRTLGITNYLRIYYFQRNRGVLISKYSKWYQKIIFCSFFYPIFEMYYLIKFLKFGRFELIKFSFTGMLHGYYFILTGTLLDIDKNNYKN